MYWVEEVTWRCVAVAGLPSHCIRQQQRLQPMGGDRTILKQQHVLIFCLRVWMIEMPKSSPNCIKEPHSSPLAPVCASAAAAAAADTGSPGY